MRVARLLPALGVIWTLWAPIAFAAVASVSSRLIDVPFMPQTPALCGGAAVAMVMRYWGDREIQPSDFQGLVRDDRRGILTSDLTDAVTRRGWKALAGESPDETAYADLRAEIDRGRPVVVLLEWQPERFHYVVVVGATASQVVLHDPARTSFLVAGVDEFDRQWRGSRRWRLVVLPPPSLAHARTEPEKAVAETRDRSGPCGALVDRGVSLADGDPAASRATLEAAAALCPKSPDPWLELSGLSFRTSNWDESAELATHAAALSASAGTSADDAWTLAGTARYMNDEMTAALAAWNRIGEPVIDQVSIDGAHRTPQPALHRMMGLQPGRLLTPGGFRRAGRAISDAPTIADSRLTFVREPDSRALVSATVVERPMFPYHPIPLVVLAGQALVGREVLVTTANVFGQGETITGGWRWPRPRQRASGQLSLPAPAPLSGVVTISAMWDQQSYLVPIGDDGAGIVKDERRRALFTVGTWVTSHVRIEYGGGFDRFGANGYGVGHLAIEEHLLDDRLAARATGEVFGFGAGAGFAGGDASVSWTSTADPRRAGWSGVVGVTAASSGSPRALWAGAGTGQGRPFLLRAHRLLDENVVSGQVFGRQLAYQTTEYRRPVLHTLAGALSVAAFVDAAEARYRVDGPTTSPLEVDAGVGLRLTTGHTGTARIDFARGLRDGRSVVSIGWSPAFETAFRGGVPW